MTKRGQGEIVNEKKLEARGRKKSKAKQGQSKGKTQGKTQGKANQNQGGEGKPDRREGKKNKKSCRQAKILYSSSTGTGSEEENQTGGSCRLG